MIKRQATLLTLLLAVAAAVAVVVCSGYFNQSAVAKTNDAAKICSTQHCCKMKCPQKKGSEIKTSGAPANTSPSFEVLPFGLPRLSFTTFFLLTDVFVVKTAVPLS
jgi:hypothetical protein